MAEGKKTVHLVGIGVTHSIAYSMHNHIASSLNLPWTFHSTECPTLDDLLALAKSPSTAGLVVTMPYKTTVLAHVDEVDEVATAIGACNNIYYKPGALDANSSTEPRRLCASNTDWLGVKGCLLEKTHEVPRLSGDRPLTGLVVGAGGASRAALYALATHLRCTTVYILNRDEQEVADLERDCRLLLSPPTIVHVTSLAQAQALATPHYIVGTVPDFAPQSEAEKTVATALRDFLSRPEKGVLLDMCFKPRRTRTIQLAERLGWSCVEGTHVIGYQIETQWRLWAGEELAAKLDNKGAWDVLLKAADESKAINFEVAAEE
ncbi:hypothetical protein Sste5346_010264 [Sporothrix stenoceras]|uniref:Shikimate dehydrogenase substrate binding N-terminal domain-containing protein n=1 Tax=Sporothrix stenoceras TaxID=5173 RepID=A0ABR3YGW3_9PEZI